MAEAPAARRPGWAGASWSRIVPQSESAAVAVVDEVEQPRLLRPVDVRGGRDLPEAAVGAPARLVAVDARARHRADPVAVLVAGDEADDRRVAQEQALDGLGRRRRACRARRSAARLSPRWTSLVGRRRVVAGRERARRPGSSSRACGGRTRASARAPRRPRRAGRRASANCVWSRLPPSPPASETESSTTKRTPRPRAGTRSSPGRWRGCPRVKPWPTGVPEVTKCCCDVLALEQQVAARVLRHGRASATGRRAAAISARAQAGRRASSRARRAARSTFTQPVAIASSAALRFWLPCTRPSWLPKMPYHGRSPKPVGQERLVHALEQAREVAHAAGALGLAPRSRSWRGE